MDDFLKTMLAILIDGLLKTGELTEEDLDDEARLFSVLENHAEKVNDNFLIAAELAQFEHDLRQTFRVASETVDRLFESSESGREQLLEILAKAPDVEPEPRDRLD